MKKELNLLVTLSLSKEERERIESVSDGIKLTAGYVKDAADIPDEQWAEVEVLYTLRALPDPMKAPKLKWVQFDTAGVDRYLEDLNELSPEVTATTMSGVITAQIAEYIVMTLLAMGHKVPLLRDYQSEKTWPERKVRHEALKPVELRNSTVGILGYGSIGREVARLLQPFNPKDSGGQTRCDAPRGYRLYPGRDGGPAWRSLPPLISHGSPAQRAGGMRFRGRDLTADRSDPLYTKCGSFRSHEENRLFGECGPGALIDEKDFVDAIRNKVIAGAALDVFEQEPLPVESPLWELENVILSPHISWLSDKFATSDCLSLSRTSTDTWQACRCITGWT